MDALDAFLTPDPDLGPDAPFAEAAEAVDPSMFDLDGDGFSETRVIGTDAGTTVASDIDADGVMDQFTTFGRDGGYESWEIFRESGGATRWRRTDFGSL